MNISLNRSYSILDLFDKDLRFTGNLQPGDKIKVRNKGILTKEIKGILKHQEYKWHVKILNLDSNCETFELVVTKAPSYADIQENIYRQLCLCYNTVLTSKTYPTFSFFVEDLEQEVTINCYLDTILENGRHSFRLEFLLEGTVMLCSEKGLLNMQLPFAVRFLNKIEPYVS